MGYTTLTATLKCICNDPFTDVFDKRIQSCSTMAVASGLVASSPGSFNPGSFLYEKEPGYEASGLDSSVLAGAVFPVIFESAHVQVMNNEYNML